MLTTFHEPLRRSLAGTDTFASGPPPAFLTKGLIEVSALSAVGGLAGDHGTRGVVELVLAPHRQHVAPGHRGAVAHVALGVSVGDALGGRRREDASVAVAVAVLVEHVAVGGMQLRGADAP